MAILNRKLKEEGIFDEMKRLEFYEKPSDAKRRRRKEAIRARKKSEKDRLKEYGALHVSKQGAIKASRSQVS